MPRAANTERATASALVGVVKSMLAAPDLEAAIRVALAEARRLTGARYAACGIVDPATGGFDRYITDGLDESIVRMIGEVPKGRGVLGLLLRQREAMRVSDIRSHPESYGFPVHHPVMTSFLGIGLWRDDTAWGSLLVTDKEGGEGFTDEDVHGITELAEFTVGVGAALRDVENAGRTIEHLSLDRDAYAASNDIARSLAGQPDLDHMIELIVKRSRAMMGVRSAVLALAGVDGLVVEGVAGTIARSLHGTILPMDEDERRVLLESGSAVARRTGIFSALADHVGGVDVMVVPLVVRRQLIGALACVDRVEEGRNFSEHDLAVADAFGTSAAVAIATARSAQEQALQRAIAASERERAHWARELHDQTLQELAAIKLMLGMASRAGSPEAQAELIEQAGVHTDAAAVDLRRLVAELRPAALDAHGLPTAIEGLVARVSQMGGQKVELRCAFPGDDRSEHGRLDPEVEGVVYRVVQEALTNVARHSGARIARVDVSLADGLLRASVSDDGIGFDPGAQSGGFGLIGMRERAELIGGDLRVESRPNEGTTVSLVAHVDEGEVCDG